MTSIQHSPAVSTLGADAVPKFWFDRVGYCFILFFDLAPLKSCSLVQFPPFLLFAISPN